MSKILMVCLGNICRSPLAHGILSHKATLENLPIKVDSAGTGSWHVGSAPDPRSIATAKKYGIDISKQKARQFNTHDFNEFDHIYVMDKSNLTDVLRLASTKEDSQKVELILKQLESPEVLSVPDPYYGGEQGFEHVYHLLDKACQQIINNIKTQL